MSGTFKPCFSNLVFYVSPKFSVVVVKKRIITRIFSTYQGRMDNPPPGTLVDTVITKPEWLELKEECVNYLHIDVGTTFS